MGNTPSGRGSETEKQEQKTEEEVNKEGLTEPGGEKREVNDQTEPSGTEGNPEVNQAEPGGTEGEVNQTEPDGTEGEVNKTEPDGKEEEVEKQDQTEPGVEEGEVNVGRTEPGDNIF